MLARKVLDIGVLNRLLYSKISGQKGTTNFGKARETPAPLDVNVSLLLTQNKPTL